MQAGKGRWQAINRWLYQTGHRLLAWKTTGVSAARPGGASEPFEGPLAPIIYIAGGRLGDALLAAAFVRHYRSFFGRPIIAIGRPETACVLAPLVDQFVPLDASADWHGKLGGASALAALPPTVKGVIGDLHLCHGNRASLDLVAAIAAPQTVLYDGWIDRSLQAPIRNWPHRSLLVSSLHKPTGTDPDRRHVLLDLAHYHRAVLDAFGIHAAVPSEPWLPDALKDKTVAPQFGLSKATIVCHIESSQRKKDWPLARWRELFAAFPSETFAVLGTNATTTEAFPENVRDLRGMTTILQAIAIALTARAFVGVDSGLAHAAGIAFVPTIVPMALATPGYFFPYPENVRPNIKTVHALAYADCAGCGGICCQELLLRCHRLGFPCVRNLGAKPVIEALTQVLDKAQHLQAVR